MIAEAVKAIRSSRRGKHIPPSHYLHTSLLQEVPVVAQLVQSIDWLDDEPTYNVIKLDAMHQRVSLLWYQAFETDDFPTLACATTCSIKTRSATTRQYLGGNPPILHRKELLLPEDHPLVEEGCRITEMLEQAGAFDDQRSIGTLKGWRRKLSSLGLDIVEGRLVER